MLSPSRVRLWLAAPVLTLLVAAPVAHAQRAVTFDTADGVTIKGTYWVSPKGRKAPAVLLIHNIDKDNGGHSHEDGWDSLGNALNKKGYAVFSFDFRGFGQSTALATSGSMLVVGASGEDAQSGAVYVFARNGGADEGRVCGFLLLDCASRQERTLPFVGENARQRNARGENDVRHYRDDLCGNACVFFARAGFT